MENESTLPERESKLLAQVRTTFENYLHRSIEQSISDVFHERKELWVESVVNLLRHELSQMRFDSNESQESGSESVWIRIASLSQLRKEVGGRFQNLRARWLEAGFPLKAHRGDPSEDYNLDDAGWLEMTSWLLKQGYESRLLDDLNQGYFEIRKPER